MRKLCVCVHSAQHSQHSVSHYNAAHAVVIPLYSILRSMLRPIFLVPSSFCSEPQYKISTPVLGSDALALGRAVLTFICIVDRKRVGHEVCECNSKKYSNCGRGSQTSALASEI